MIVEQAEPVTTGDSVRAKVLSPALRALNLFF
jgi:hypothetical protein